MEIDSSNHKFPMIKASLIVFLFLILILVLIFVSLNVLGATFTKLGFPPEYSVYFLFLSIPGSFVNLPIPLKMRSIINVNVGGAVIPAIMSVLLASKVNLFNVIIAVLILSFLIYIISRPVKNSGIRVHLLIPAILTSATALTISPQEAPFIAYISGTIGCLIGVDLLNLKRIPELGLRMVSIGGAGIFDAVFLTGIISVLLV